MKQIKYIMVALVALSALSLSSCKKPWLPDYLEKGGSTQAEIGFSDSELKYKENAGMIKLAVSIQNLSDKVKVEDISYPISFDVEAKVTDASGKDITSLYKFTQSKGYSITSLNSTMVELEFIDNTDENEDVTTEISITNVKGAKIGSNGTLKMIVADNDKNPYEKLQGKWKMVCKSVDLKTGALTDATFDVSIVGGCAAADDLVTNFEKTLFIWGFHGYTDDYSAYVDQVVYPLQDIMQMSYDYDNTQLALLGGKYIGENINFGLGDDQQIWSAVSEFDTAASAWGAMSKRAKVFGTWSKDFNTITFESGKAYAGCVYLGKMPSSGTYVGDDSGYKGYWGAYTNIVLTRVQ